MAEHPPLTCQLVPSGFRSARDRVPASPFHHHENKKKNGPGPVCICNIEGQLNSGERKTWGRFFSGGAGRNRGGYESISLRFEQARAALEAASSVPAKVS